MILGSLGAKAEQPQAGQLGGRRGGGYDGLVQLFAQNQRLFPAGDDLGEVIRIARIQLEQALAARAAG